MAHDFGIWRQYGATAPFLGTAIRRLGSTLSMHQSGRSLALHPVGQRYVCRYSIAPSRCQQITSMPITSSARCFRLCRQYLGWDWKPEAIEVNYRRDADAALHRGTAADPHSLREAGVGVVLKPSDLAQRLQSRGRWRGADHPTRSGGRRHPYRRTGAGTLDRRLGRAASPGWSRRYRRNGRDGRPQRAGTSAAIAAEGLLLPGDRQPRTPEASRGSAAGDRLVDVRYRPLARLRGSCHLHPRVPAMVWLHAVDVPRGRQPHPSRSRAPFDLH